MAAVDNKMIEVSVRFTTDGLGEKGQVLPKHGWTIGFVNLRANSRHGITSENPVPFNSLAELPVVIERVLAQQGVKLHLNSKAKRLYVP
jgi:hypothetical protein